MILIVGCRNQELYNGTTKILSKRSDILKRLRIDKIYQNLMRISRELLLWGLRSDFFHLILTVFKKRYSLYVSIFLVMWDMFVDYSCPIRSSSLVAFSSSAALMSSSLSRLSIISFRFWILACLWATIAAFSFSSSWTSTWRFICSSI